MHQRTSSHCDAKGIMDPEAWKCQEIKLKVKEAPENQRVNWQSGGYHKVSDEVEPPSKQIQDEETDMVA